MASLENKYGKSAVDATRRNALPPYLDTLFEGGIGGGAGVETHNVTLTTANWNNLQQNVVLTCGATNASDVICAGDNSTMDADYYLAAFGVKLTSASVVEGEEEGVNTVTFTFTAASMPTTNISVVIIIVNSEGSTSSYLNDLVEAAENAANHYPTIQSGNWYVWNISQNSYTDTGVGATGPQGPKGVGVPSGGSTGQVLTKTSATNYATQWTTPLGMHSTTVTLPASGWTASGNLYTQSATISWMLSTDIPLCQAVCDDETDAEAWGNIIKTVSSAGTLTFTALEALSVNLDIQVVVIR